MKNAKSRHGLPRIAEKTLTRRSLLDWLGKATVIALGSDVLAACSIAEDGDITIDGVDTGDGGSPPSTDSTSFAFQPGEEEGEVFENWGERTVDRQDLETILKTWTLRVDGLVEKPFSLSFGDLLKLERRDMVADFHCVEGWSVFDIPWNGVHLSTLLALAKPLGGATHVTFHTAKDIYGESLPLDVALEPDTLLAYGIQNSSLPLGKGFPLRLVVPRKLAYKSAKYVYRIELDNEPRLGYWEKYGYPYEADVPPERLRSR